MDVHMHSSFSDGMNTAEDMIISAASHGVSLLAITDHYDPNDYRPSISMIKESAILDHLQKIKIAAKSFSSIRVLCGIETSPLYSGKLDISDEVRENSEILITSCHYLGGDFEIIPGFIYNDEYWNAYKEYMINMALGEGDVLGHMEGYLPIHPFLQGINTTYDERQRISAAVIARYCDRKYVDEMVEVLRVSGKSCELHNATRTPRESTIRRMHSAGISFVCSSDAHNVENAGRTEWAQSMVEKYSLKLREF